MKTRGSAWSWTSTLGAVAKMFEWQYVLVDLAPWPLEGQLWGPKSQQNTFLLQNPSNKLGTQNA